MMPKLFVALCALGANAFLPKTPLSARPARAPARTAPRALLDVFVAGQLATAPIDASKLDLPSTVVISAKEKIQREGLYGSYEVEVDNGPRPAPAGPRRGAGAPRERRAAAARAARDETRAGRRASGDARAPSTPAPPQASTRPTTRGRRSRARPRPKRARTSTSASSSSSSSAPSSSPWPSTSGTCATRPTASSTSRRRRRRRRPRRSSGSARRRTPRSAAERSAGCANLATISTLGRAAVRGAGEGGVRVPRARARAASTERPPTGARTAPRLPARGGALPGRNASRRTLADAHPFN